MMRTLSWEYHSHSEIQRNRKQQNKHNKHNKRHHTMPTKKWDKLDLTKPTIRGSAFHRNKVTRNTAPSVSTFITLRPRQSPQLQSESVLQRLPPRQWQLHPLWPLQHCHPQRAPHSVHPPLGPYRSPVPWPWSSSIS